MVEDIFEQLLVLAKEKSDHLDRVVELEPSIIESLANTSPQYPALEIGNYQGGSALLILAHIHREGQGRKLITADANGPNPNITQWTQTLNIPTEHFKGSQAEFVANTKEKYGFIYLDADHDEVSVTRDIGILIANAVQGCIIAVDDVQGWDKIPEFPELDRVDYKVDQGSSLGKSGVHFIAYRRK